MTRQRLVARGAVLGGGVVLLGVLVYLGSDDGAREPQGVLPHIARDAGPSDAGVDAGPGGPALSRLDGAVQLFLPDAPTPEGVEISPEEMRARHLQQIELIERRIEQLETQLADQPGSTVIEARLAQLRTRRDELRALTEP